jgi:hypothetical protein
VDEIRMTKTHEEYCTERQRELRLKREFAKQVDKERYTRAIGTLEHLKYCKRTHGVDEELIRRLGACTYFGEG